MLPAVDGWAAMENDWKVILQSARSKVPKSLVQMIYLSKFVAGKRMVMIYISTDFNREQSAIYTLLVRVGSHENALAIVGDDGQLKLITTYDPMTIEQEVADLLDLDFAAVKLSLSGSRYVFIPEEVFDETVVQLYLRHLPDDGLASTVVSDIAPFGLKILHQTDRLQAEPFAKRFPGVLTYASTQVLLQSIAGHGLKTNAPALVIDKQASTLTICFFEGNRFVYANDFDVTGSEDCAYYLVSVSKHLGLEDKRPGICLSGNILADDEIHQWSMANGDGVVFADSSALVHMAIPEQLTSQQHRFLTLLGLHLCG